MVNAFIGTDVVLNGPHPWDPCVKNEHRDVLLAALEEGDTLALGDAYMQGRWQCADLPGLLTRLWNGSKNKPKPRPSSLRKMLTRRQDILTSRQNVEQHYDIGMELYERMLDPSGVYTCAYFSGDAWTLEQAQEAKLDLVCRKADLKAGHTVWDIGAGYNAAFERHAYTRYGASVVGSTLSRDQAESARKKCADMLVSIRTEDFRENCGPGPDQTESRYDRIVSIGMFEQVGRSHYDEFFAKTASLLKPEGIFVLHTIIGGSLHGSDAWLHKHIFHDGDIPRDKDVRKSSAPQFDIIDMHTFGHYYAQTLALWHANFKEHLPELRRMFPKKYDETFERMWTLYLSGSEACFATGRTNLAQYVMVPKGSPLAQPGAYTPVR